MIHARATGEAPSSTSPSPTPGAVDSYRSESFRAYERPEAEVTRNKADNYERRAPGTPAWSRACNTRSRGGRRPLRPLHGVPAAFWKISAKAWAGSTSSSADPAQVRRPRPRQPRAPARAAGHLPHQVGAGMARVRRPHQHPYRPGGLPKTCSTIRSSPTGSAPAGVGSGRGPALHPVALRRRAAATARQGAHGGTAHRSGLALGVGL